MRRRRPTTIRNAGPATPYIPFSSCPLDREALCAQLTYYSAALLSHIVDRRPLRLRIEEPAPPPVVGEPEAVPVSRRLKVRLPWEAVEIGTGFLGGELVVDPFGTLSFRIPNPHLLPEFQHIRGYFRKALRRSTLEVTAELHFPGGEPELRNARSPQVDRIDGRMLQLFRSRALRRLTNPESSVDQGLFTPSDFLASLDDDDPARTLLPPAGQDLLLALLEDRNVRNAAQLRYLATERQQRGQPLRYVLSPQFGFVFLVIGEEMHHFVLELLDSHATYVWSLPRGSTPLAEHYRLVEREIRRLNELGRAAYRRAGTEGPDFRIVAHDHAASALIDGFPVWRAKLEEGLW